jgi:hypothetical protein
MNKRKLIIGLVTFAGVLFIFGIYNLLVKTPEIILDNKIADDEKITVPDFDDKAGEIAGTRIVADDVAEFLTRDEKTKRIKRIFGFEKLLNPSEGGNLWRLQKPYMKIMEDKFRCDIRSKRGKVRIETILGEVNPVMAELNDEVKIVIHMLEDNKKIEVTLDDLVYDNERCEFVSEGPVKLVSDDGIMEGTGMIMIYDGEVGKLAYLEIMNLDYLILKNVAKDDSTEKDTAAKPKAKTETVTAAGSDVAAVNPDVTTSVDKPVAKNDNAPKPAVKKDDTKPIAEKEKYKYYECRLLDNVNIEYGKRLVIVGADEVTISNILWSDDKDDESKSSQPAETQSTAKADTHAAAKTTEPAVKENIAQTNEPAVKENVAAPGDTETKTQKDVSGDRDVYVTCNGSLIIRPMELTNIRPRRLSINNRRVMEFTGRPLRVGQLIDNSSKDIETIATCGAMIYDIDREVLDLITNDTERYVELTMTENQANIYTQGSVRWNRRDNNALIVGPGMLLMQEKGSDDQASNMKFDGVMNIFFAGRPNELAARQLSLSAVNIVGGMIANINKDGHTTIKSDMADFKFVDGRRITHADLNGNVDFTSDTGRLNSGKAQILFARNDAGKNIPVKMTGFDDAVLEPKGISGARPTRFHAQKIDYDMLSGIAVATGPVKFIFYAPEEDDSAQVRQVPVVITAERNAKFFPTENQVVFNGSVVGTKLSTQPGFDQRDSFYGDQLIVDVAKSQVSGKDEIKHVRVVGGLVELRSKRTAGNVVISHIGLACLQIDYDADTGVIIAAGDGTDDSRILINNKNAPEPQQQKTKGSKKKNASRSLDISGSCVASVSGFETLTWNTAVTELKSFDDDPTWWDNIKTGIEVITGGDLPWLTDDVPEKETLIVDGGAGQINIGYIPFKDGQRGQVVHAATKHLTGKFAESPDGKLDIVWLKAKDGIVYEEVGLHRMMGDSMLYTGADSIMVIKAAKGQDCIVDGVRMPQIEYNLRTGKIKSKLSSRPGIIRMR